MKGLPGGAAVEHQPAQQGQHPATVAPELLERHARTIRGEFMIDKQRDSCRPPLKSILARQLGDEQSMRTHHRRVEAADPQRRVPTIRPARALSPSRQHIAARPEPAGEVVARALACIRRARNRAGPERDWPRSRPMLRAIATTHSDHDFYVPRK